MHVDIAFHAFKRILDMNREYAFSMLFFIYFAVYVMSPLSYTCASHNVDDKGIIAQRQRAAESDIRISLWEFVFANLSAKEVPHRIPSDKLIVKKARAIMPENTISRVLSFEDGLPDENRSYALYGTGFRALRSPATNGPERGFLAFYSGHSPPLV